MQSLMGKGKYSRYERLEQEIQDQNQGDFTSTRVRPLRLNGDHALDTPPSSRPSQPPTGFIDGQQQSQTTIMREQDSQLEEVGQTIGNLRQMGEMISDELESQAECVGGGTSALSFNFFVVGNTGLTRDNAHCLTPQT
jgi:syntaxin 6